MEYLIPYCYGNKPINRLVEYDNIEYIATKQSKIMLQEYEGDRRPKHLLKKCQVDATQSGVEVFFALNHNGVIEVKTACRFLISHVVPLANQDVVRHFFHLHFFFPINIYTYTSI